MKHTNHHVRHLTGTTRLWILVCGVVVLTAVVAALLLTPGRAPVVAGVAVVADSARPTVTDTTDVPTGTDH